MISRRSLIGSMIALVAAPAIVRCASLMPVKVMPAAPALQELLMLRIRDAEQVLAAAMSENLYAGSIDGVSVYFDDRSEESRAFMPRLHRETWRVRGWEVSL